MKNQHVSVIVGIRHAGLSPEAIRAVGGPA